ncbi:MAG TPA: hypothetical protein VGE04_19435 [Chloroflexia bacterium]|jgi:hypothetical protein
MLQWLNEYGGLLACLGFLLSIPLAVVANLMTPSAKDWFAQRSKANARKRILKLQEELKEKSELYDQPTRMLTYVLLFLMAMVLGLFIGLLGTVMAVLFYLNTIYKTLSGISLMPIFDADVEYLRFLQLAFLLSGALLLFLDIYILVYVYRFTSDVLNFQKHKITLEKRISRLEQQAGGSP